MKPPVYFYLFLCVAFFIAGRQVHAGNAPAKQFHQAAPVKTVFSFGSSVQAVFELPKPEQETNNMDSVIGMEDDDDEEELMGEQAPVIRHHAVTLTVCALPPPESLSSKSISATASPSLLRSCRYLAHQALLI